MKTAILTIATIIATVFGFSQSTFAKNKNRQAITTLTGVAVINKIEVHGNVELYVTSGTSDKVKVYDDYYAQGALVQNENGVLNISSYTAKKLVVWVTAADLRDLAVYDNAEVKSFGKVSAIDLDVQLFNSATARLDLDTYATNVTLAGSAKATLSGTINEAGMSYVESTSLNISNLNAAHLANTTKIIAIDANAIPELASL